MSKITITIETDNEVFGDSPLNEVARILRKIADNGTYDGQKLIDLNGNTVGKVEVE